MEPMEIFQTDDGRASEQQTRRFADQQMVLYAGLLSRPQLRMISSPVATGPTPPKQAGGMSLVAVSVSHVRHESRRV